MLGINKAWLCLLRAILKRLRAIYKYMGTLFNYKRISKLLVC